MYTNKLIIISDKNNPKDLAPFQYDRTMEFRTYYGVFLLRLSGSKLFNFHLSKWESTGWTLLKEWSFWKVDNNYCELNKLFEMELKRVEYKLNLMFGEFGYTKIEFNKNELALESFKDRLNKLSFEEKKTRLRQIVKRATNGIIDGPTFPTDGWVFHQFNQNPDWAMVLFPIVFEEALQKFDESSEFTKVSYPEYDQYSLVFSTVGQETGYQLTITAPNLVESND